MTIHRWSVLFRSSLLVLGLFLVGGLLTAPTGSFAQSMTDDPSPLVKHLQNKLQSKNSIRRESALVDVIALATCPSMCTVSFQSINKENKKKIYTFANEAGTGYEVNLKALIPNLMEAYRSGPADGHRLLALSALINIGDAKTLEQLVDEGARQSAAMNNATQRSLAAFYLEKYPVLRNRSMRTGTITLDDVRRAEAVHVKRTKKFANQ